MTLGSALPGTSGATALDRLNKVGRGDGTQTGSAASNGPRPQTRRRLVRGLQQLHSPLRVEEILIGAGCASKDCRGPRHGHLIRQQGALRQGEPLPQ
jgi:hypothetical protein